MTEAEAKEILSDFSRCVTVKADGIYETIDFLDAKELAINALEKEFSVSREIRHGDYFCPKCGSHVDYQGYCHACGQKVY